MYRIRFHGRGGQGMKTASRILGHAFFNAGYEVQDAPRYGAERRGAPIFAYVRADRSPINERGIIANPDLVVVADDTLVGMGAAGVTTGIDAHTLLLINSHEDAATWSRRLNSPAKILILESAEALEDRAALPFIGTRCAAAAAALCRVISLDDLLTGLDEELGNLGAEVVRQNHEIAAAVYADMSARDGAVEEGSLPDARDYTPPAWVDLPFESADVSAIAIRAGGTSVEVRTGLWRTMRPVIDYDRCNRCWWICSTYCPDGAIAVRDEDRPEIDYDHCKGCLVCVAQCPPGAIESIPEQRARERDQEAAT